MLRSLNEANAVLATMPERTPKTPKPSPEPIATPRSFGHDAWRPIGDGCYCRRPLPTLDDAEAWS